MQAILSVATLLIGIAIILMGNGLLGTLLGVRGELEGFSPSMLGLIMGVYFAGYVAGTMIVPGMIRQVGHIRIFTALASIASIATLTHGLVVHPVSWMLGRAITGFCIVGMYIALESWLNSQTTNESRGHIFSAYMTTTLVGLGIGQLLLLAGDVETLFLFAVASVLLSLGLVPVALTRVREPAIEDVERLGMRKLYEASPSGMVSSFFSGLGSGALWGLGPVFAAGIGMSKNGISAFMALTILGGILLMWPIGKLSDRYDRRSVLMWVCAATAIAALMALWLARIDPKWVMFGGFLFGAFIFSIFSMAVAHTNDHVDYSQMLETTASLQLLWGSGAVIGPIMAGLIMQLTSPMAFLPFLAVAGLIPAIFIRYRSGVSDPVSAEEQGDYVAQFATSPVALEMYPEPEQAEEQIDVVEDEADSVSEAR
jgi:MFS family permease